jgi:hypothetical protein
MELVHRASTAAKRFTGDTSGRISESVAKQLKCGTRARASEIVEAQCVAERRGAGHFPRPECAMPSTLIRENAAQCATYIDEA